MYSQCHSPSFTIAYFTDNESKEAGADNRNIVDDGKSQKLTRDDIEMLKEQGLKGQVSLLQILLLHVALVSVCVCVPFA